MIRYEVNYLTCKITTTKFPDNVNKTYLPYLNSFATWKEAQIWLIGKAGNMLSTANRALTNAVHKYEKIHNLKESDCG